MIFSTQQAHYRQVTHLLCNLHFGSFWVNKDACREPISSVFHDVFDENKDGVLEFSELPGFNEFSMDPCMMAFFEKCAGGKKILTEKEFCSCFSSVGKLLSLFWFLNQFLVLLIIINILLSDSNILTQFVHST